MTNRNLVSIRAWGDFACFTRPEMKVERVSYPVMTPSAARGILEAIFWEPQIYYLIDSIRVVKRGKWVSFRRNEVQRVISIDSAKTWMKSPGEVVPIQADDSDVRAQRNMLALEDVEYIICAEVRLTDLGSRVSGGLKKYLDEIERRARAGKCFHRPAFGVREFAVNFDWEADAQSALERRATESHDNWREIWPEEDLGLMLYDVFDANSRARGFRWLRDEETAEIQAQREASIVTFPKSKQKAVRKESLPISEGEVIKPLAAFFRARITEARLDCHPERVTILGAAK